MYIKRTNLDELDDIIKLASLCKDKMQENGFDFWDEYYPTKPDFKKDIIKKTHYSFLIKEKLIGCVTIDEEMSLEYLKGKWKYLNFRVIHKLMIDPLEQGKGYSKAGMTLIEKMLKCMNIESIRLSVYIKNIRADKLYKKSGYKLRGITELRKGTCNLYEKKI